MLPRFRDGNFAGGIKDGVRDIILVLTGDAAEVEQRAKARHDADEPAVNWLMVIFWTLIILWIAYSMWSSARYASRAGGRSTGPIFLPGPGWGSGSGGSGWSSGGGGGGGFSGGGGSFRRRRRLGWMVRPCPCSLSRLRTRPPSPRPSPARKRRPAARSWWSWPLPPTATAPSRCCGRRCIALAVPMPLIFATKWPVEYIYLLQLVVFFVCPRAVPMGAACASPWCRNPSSAPARIRRAVEQFLVQNMHTTKGRTGVLIYVSFAERFAEVIADEGIYSKVPPSTWEDVVGELTNHLARGTTTRGLHPRHRALRQNSRQAFPARPSRQERAPQPSDRARCVWAAVASGGARRREPSERTGKRALLGWVLFDWATQPFYTLVVTFLFAPYFVNGFMADPAQGSALWAYATGIAELIAAALAPVLGAIADAGQHAQALDRRLLRAAGGRACAACGSRLPAATDLDARRADCLRPRHHRRRACHRLHQRHDGVARLRASGSAPCRASAGRRAMSAAWSASRSSPASSSPIPAPARPCSGLQPIVPLDPATREGDRLVGPFSAALVSRLRPAALSVHAGPAAPKPLEARAVRAGLAQLVRSVKDLVRNHGQVALFLLARMLYADGLGAVFAFGGIYAATVFGWGATELGLFGIILTIAGTFGAVFGGLLDDRVGSKHVIVVHAACCSSPLDRRALGRPRPCPVRAAGRAEASGQRGVLVDRRAGLSRLRHSDRARLRPDPGVEPHAARENVPARQDDRVLRLLLLLRQDHRVRRAARHRRRDAATGSQRIGIATSLVFLVAGLLLLLRVKSESEAVAGALPRTPSLPLRGRDGRALSSAPGGVRVIVARLSVATRSPRTASAAESRAALPARESEELAPSSTQTCGLIAATH